jgi:hypothetical protein
MIEEENQGFVQSPTTDEIIPEPQKPGVSNMDEGIPESKEHNVPKMDEGIPESKEPGVPKMDEEIPEPKEPDMPKSPHSLMIAVIAIAVILIGGFVVWIYPGEGEVDDISAFVVRQPQFEATTMICESFDNDVCQRKNEKIFQRGETIIIATRISPTVDEDLDVDLLFNADIVLPDGNIVNNVNQYNFKKTIQKNKFSNYLFELTPREKTAFGEYTIVLRFIDNIGGYKKIVEKTFTLYNGAR